MEVSLSDSAKHTKDTGCSPLWGSPGKHNLMNRARLRCQGALVGVSELR